MESMDRRALYMALLGMLLMLFTGALDSEKSVAAMQPTAVYQHGDTCIYTGPQEMPAGEYVQYSLETLLEGNLLCVSASSPLPEDAPVQQSRNVRKMIGLYAPVAQEVSLSEETIYALCDMCAENPLVKTWITDGMRSPGAQHALQDAAFDMYRGSMTTQAALMAARRDVPNSGESEHQLATSFDIKLTGALDWSKEDPLERSADGLWLKENAWRFGFIRRYPAEKQQITGVFNEELHFRYVGRTHARVMQAMDWCLEEYLDMLAVCGQITIVQGEKTSYVLSCPITSAGAAFCVPAGFSASVSADNRGRAVCLLEPR